MSKKFDLKTVYNADRPLSWSAISSFEWNPSQWYAKYVAKELPEITPELEFGSMVDKRIQEDPTYLPELVRYPILQHKMTGTFNKIPLLGYADTFRPMTPKLDVSSDGKHILSTQYYRPAIRDYKTGHKLWDQKRADQTGQLTMYLFMLYLRDKIQPEDVECYIDWMPTHYVDSKIAFVKEGEIHTFKTKRTMQQVLAFGQRIKDTWAAMEAYAEREAQKEVHSLAEWH